MKHILFLGSSIVAGNFGVDWISKLPKIEGIQYHNYGINGAQVPTIINLVKSNKITITPFAIIIMVGGNDVTNSIPLKKYGGMMSERYGRPMTNAKQFGEEIEELLHLIKDKWGVLPIGVFNLKPHSENIDGNLNLVVRSFNDILLEKVNHFPNITYLDLYSRLIKLLEGHIPSIHADDIEYVVDIRRMLIAFILKYFNYSMNDVGEARGFFLFCDGLHFNERAVNEVLQLFNPFLTKILSI